MESGLGTLRYWALLLSAENPCKRPLRITLSLFLSPFLSLPPVYWSEGPVFDTSVRISLWLGHKQAINRVTGERPWDVGLQTGPGEKREQAVVKQCHAELVVRMIYGFELVFKSDI